MDVVKYQKHQNPDWHCGLTGQRLMNLDMSVQMRITEEMVVV